jgi:hypothetical protein
VTDGRAPIRRLAAFAMLACVAAGACVSVVLLGRPRAAVAGTPTSGLAPITARSSIAALARHFGRPSESSFHAGSQVDVWVSRDHDWTIVRYIHPRPKPEP